MKIYKLYFSKLYYSAMFFIPGMMTIMGVFLIVGSAIGALSSNAPGWPFLVIYMGIISWIWYWVLRVVYEIRILDDGKVEFKSCLKRVKIYPSDIISIKANPNTLGYIDLKYGGGKIYLLNQMDGFHEFIVFMEKANPNMEIRGC